MSGRDDCGKIREEDYALSFVFQVDKPSYVMRVVLIIWFKAKEKGGERYFYSAPLRLDSCLVDLAKWIFDRLVL